MAEEVVARQGGGSEKDGQRRVMVDTMAVTQELRVSLTPSYHKQEGEGVVELQVVHDGEGESVDVPEDTHVPQNGVEKNEVVHVHQLDWEIHVRLIASNTRCKLRACPLADWGNDDDDDGDGDGTLQDMGSGRREACGVNTDGEDGDNSTDCVPRTRQVAMWEDTQDDHSEGEVGRRHLEESVGLYGCRRKNGKEIRDGTDVPQSGVHSATWWNRPRDVLCPVRTDTSNEME